MAIEGNLVSEANYLKKLISYEEITRVLKNRSQAIAVLDALACYGIHISPT